MSCLGKMTPVIYVASSGKYECVVSIPLIGKQYTRSFTVEESNGQLSVIMNICTQPSNEEGGCIIDNYLKQLLTKETCINPRKITLLDIIGSGSYGIVRRAIWRGMKVAAKVLHFPERTSRTIQCEN